MLKNYKKEIIIILTGHSLDKVKYLDDRIENMSEGHFIYSETSSFLKINILIDIILF